MMWHQMEIPVVSSVAMPLIAALLARYPKVSPPSSILPASPEYQYAGEVVPFFADGVNLEAISQEALSCYVWLLGEFGQYAPFAPDLLEGLVDRITAERSDDVDGSALPRLGTGRQ